MFKTVFAALAFAAATPGLAAQGTAPPAPAANADPDAIAAARELLGALNYDDQFAVTARQTSESTLTTMLRELSSQQRALPVELEAEFRTIMRDHVEQMIVEMRPTVVDDAARVYARYFTAGEIRQLQELMTHPVLAKMQSIGPQLSNELLQIGVAASVRRLPALQERLREVVQEWQRRQPEQAAVPAEPEPVQAGLIANPA
jgi:uncharacterized protein